MISSFFIRNYRSILELNLDFSFAEGRAPNGYLETENYHFLCPSEQEKDKRRNVACLALFGPNASGKSNILGAMKTLHQVACLKTVPISISPGGHVTEIPSIERNFQPNKLDEKYSITTFQISFFTKGIGYSYLIGYNNSKIAEEILSKNGEKLFSIENNIGDFCGIECNSYGKNRLQDILNYECSLVKQKKRTQISSFLSGLFHGHPGFSEDISNVHDYIGKMIILNNPLPSCVSLRRSGILQEAEYEKIFQKRVNIIKKFDISISRAELKNRTVKTYHNNVNGKEIEFAITEESRGTQILFGLIDGILLAIDEGRPIVIDELDASLHPLLLREIIRMFKNKSYNRKKAQILFSSNNTDILEDELLKISEVAIVDKNAKDGTTVRRLSDFNGIKNATDFRKQYLEGRFSGIPFPYI